MKVIVIGDTHIDDVHIDELRDVFDEIMQYEADHVVHLGDYYNSRKPSPQSLAFGTEMAKKLVDKYKNVTIMAGNGRHNWLNGFSVVDYLKSFGVEVVGMELEKEIDGKNCFFGHYMTNESYKEYGSHEYTVKELKKYDLVLLGHQHIPQELTPDMHHVGSSIFQHFNEVKDPHKRFAIIENGDLSFIKLKSPIPMKDATNVEELSKIDPKTKVRLLIPDFGTFKNVVKDLPKWKEHFVDFKYELRYEKVSVQIKPKINAEKKQLCILDEIKKIDDTDVRIILENLFKKAPNDC